MTQSGHHSGNRNEKLQKIELTYILSYSVTEVGFAFFYKAKIKRFWQYFILTRYFCRTVNFPLKGPVFIDESDLSNYINAFFPLSIKSVTNKGDDKENRRIPLNSLNRKLTVLSFGQRAMALTTKAQFFFITDFFSFFLFLFGFGRE